MSITAGWALLGLGFVALFYFDGGGWLPGRALPSSDLRLAYTPSGIFVLCLALLLITLERLPDFRAPAMARRVLAAGSYIYALGAGLQLFVPRSAWLLVLGAGTACVGAMGLSRLRAEQTLRGSGLLSVVISMGPALESVLVASTLGEGTFLQAAIGEAEGIAQRLLRLARVAAVVLPILALLLADLEARKPAAAQNGKVIGWLVGGLSLGAVGMPLVLVMAALVDLRWKYLLPLPADLTLAGILTGVWLSFRQGAGPERMGWLLIAASMTVGMLMGGYAFDGPFPSPVGDYGDSVRTLMRNWHAGFIVLGIGLLLVQAQSHPWVPGSPANRGPT